MLYLEEPSENLLTGKFKLFDNYFIIPLTKIISNFIIILWKCKKSLNQGYAC